MKKTFSKAASIYDAIKTINSKSGNEIINRLKEGQKPIAELTDKRPDVHFHFQKLTKFGIVEVSKQRTKKICRLNEERYLALLKLEKNADDFWLISKSKNRQSIVKELFKSEIYKPEYITSTSLQLSLLVKAGLAERITDEKDLRRATWKRTEKLENLVTLIDTL